MSEDKPSKNKSIKLVANLDDDFEIDAPVAQDRKSVV